MGVRGGGAPTDKIMKSYLVGWLGHVPFPSNNNDNNNNNNNNNINNNEIYIYIGISSPYC